MGKPAARIGDMHVCPMVNPGAPPPPHVGGPVAGAGAPTVLIGGMPAALLGDTCICSGPPDSIIMGSTGVLIGGKPAARMGDPTAHGGSIVAGCPTVLIGETMPGGGAVVVGPVTPVTIKVDALKFQDSLLENMTSEMANTIAQTGTLKEAAESGTPFCEECNK